MSRYIDAEELNKKLGEAKNSNLVFNAGVAKAQMIVREMTTADVEEVVRCKDCKYLNDRDDNILRWCKRLICGCVKDNFFCADGERREEE